MIDVGCGTGEHSILFASKGHRALGIDSAPLAIEKARGKAKARKSKAEFELADALDLPALGRTFDTAIDCGLFHIFSDRERVSFQKGLREALNPGGRYFMLCFSEREPSDWGGPRRVTQREIIDTFSSGWDVDYIKPAKFDDLLHDGSGGEAWLSRISRSA